MAKTEKEDQKNTTATEETPEQFENVGPGQEAPEEDIFTGIPNPCVYCGPTVRGMARQYTTFQGGIPDVLRDFIQKYPEARQLIVSTARFPTMRKQLDTPGTAETALYKQVRGQLGK